MEFRKYMHIERFGSDEVQGIELGECYVFPKLDGTNASVWVDSNDQFCAGSRNRELSIDNDNAGFYAAMLDNGNVRLLLEDNPTLRLYGEWLVPHSLRTYRNDAWRKFYVFDVYNNETERYLSYEEYKPLLDEYRMDYVPPLCIMRNATYDSLLVELKNNGFLIQDGKGHGEGIVIKNYNFVNRFQRTTWAKIVSNEFKEKNAKTIGATVKNMKEMTEAVIAQKYVTSHLVEKVYSKIVNENDGWNSKYIPRLLNEVYHDLVTEEMWDIVKSNKNPTINFKTLNTLVIMEIKKLKSEIF